MVSTCTQLILTKAFILYFVLKRRTLAPLHMFWRICTQKTFELAVILPQHTVHGSTATRDPTNFLMLHRKNWRSGGGNSCTRLAGLSGYSIRLSDYIHDTIKMHSNTQYCQSPKVCMRFEDHDYTVQFAPFSFVSLAVGHHESSGTHEPGFIVSARLTLCFCNLGSLGH